MGTLEIRTIDYFLTILQSKYCSLFIYLINRWENGTLELGGIKCYEVMD